MTDGTAPTEADESITLATDLSPEQAGAEITKAATVRHKLALKYVGRLRKRNPDATPEEIIELLERHYVRAIAVAGGAITAATIAANVAVSLLPAGGAAKEGGKVAVKATGKVAAKKAAKQAAKMAAANQAVSLIPAGDAQVQFEITAIFALALAEIHGMKLDKEQSSALIYGLSNDRVGQAMIAKMATDVAAENASVASVGTAIASGQEDWSHWATTLADALPGGAAQQLVTTMQTGQLETVRAGLSGSQRTAIEYGVGAITGGASRFVFGRQVVDAARVAFAEPPTTFPAHLALSEHSGTEDDEPNRAISALEDAAKYTGTWVSEKAEKATRVFRSVDLDGDGIPDEAQALTAAKAAGEAVAGAVTSGARAFRRIDRDGDGVPDDSQVRTAARGLREGVASKLKRGAKGDQKAPESE